MKAIRVRKRVKGEHYAVHLLADEEETVCRLQLDEIDSVADLDIETLPPLEGCGSCRRIADGWTPVSPRNSIDESRVTLSPSLGSIRRTGPLQHGTRRHRGSRLR